MSKVLVALEKAIKAIEHPWNVSTAIMPNSIIEAINLCKSALSDIGKCEPVINLNILKYTEHGVIPDDFKGQASGYRAGWNDCLSSVQYMFSQPIDKCEPVAEALHERNRLGYAVVDVIGTLDEIIENAQEVEVDDFLHIAIPIDKWHELQDALEEMPKRAELYTSPQPIEKCAPVYLIVSGADEIVVTKEKYDSWSSAKRISYTSPISKEWVVIDEETIDDIGNTLSDEQGFIPVETWTEFARAIEAKLKQLNVEKG